MLVMGERACWWLGREPNNSTRSLTWPTRVMVTQVDLVKTQVNQARSTRGRGTGALEIPTGPMGCHKNKNKYSNRSNIPKIPYFHVFVNLREFVLTHVILTTGACGRRVRAALDATTLSAAAAAAAAGGEPRDLNF